MWSSDSDLLSASDVEDKRMCSNTRGCVVPKGEGKEAYTSSAALTVPGHVTIHRLRTEGGKHTSKCVLDYYCVYFASQSQERCFDGVKKNE